MQLPASRGACPRGLLRGGKPRGSPGVTLIGLASVTYPGFPRRRSRGPWAGGDSMRQVPGRALWLGNAGDLRDARALLAAGIAAVVELADSEPLAVLPRELVRCRFPLSDGGDNPLWLVRLAV